MYTIVQELFQIFFTDIGVAEICKVARDNCITVLERVSKDCSKKMNENCATLYKRVLTDIKAVAAFCK